MKRGRRPILPIPISSKKLKRAERKAKSLEVKRRIRGIRLIVEKNLHPHFSRCKTQDDKKQDYLYCLRNKCLKIIAD